MLICCNYSAHRKTIQFNRDEGDTGDDIKIRSVKLMDSQIVIPEAIQIGNPVCNQLKSWMPDRDVRA